jgi:transposase
MCIALSCNASPKKSLPWKPCADRWEKIAGIGSQAATNAQAPQSVQACPSLALLRQVWNQHFEQVDGLIGFRDGPAAESAERIISPYETEARANRKRETEWVGYKVHLTEICSEEEAVHLIVQAEITAATVQDVELSMPLLHDLQERELTPEERLLDSGYVSGEVLAKHAELGVELVGPLKQEGGWQSHGMRNELLTCSEQR